MKAEKFREILYAVVLSFLLAFGAVGCGVTGLELNVTDMGRLALLCAAAAAVTGLLSHVRFGGWLVSGMMLATALGLWLRESWQIQLLDMLCRITRYYHNAYGWPQVASPYQGNGPMDWPVYCFALWIAASNCWCLHKGVGNYTGITAAALPLVASVVVTDTVPHSPYLYLWLLGMTLVLLSAGLRKQSTGARISFLRMAAVPVALALGLLFWAVPREGYDRQPDKLQQEIVDWYQQLPDRWKEVREEVASNLDGTVQPQSLRLDTLGTRIRRVYPVMEVRAPVSGRVYLRGQHYDVYTGTGWQVTQGREAFGSPEGTTRELGTITISTRNTRDVVYLPYYPDPDLELADGRLDNARKETVYSYTQRGLASHWRNMVISASLGMEAPLFNRQQAKNLQNVNLYLPEDTYRWAVDKVDTLLSDEVTATAVADTIGEYVRGSARYDRNPGRMDRDAEDFARWFLEESDTGYCVHFATAATVLLRAAGVEARYVEGYLFTARMGEETTVIADEAHAWAEYYEPLLGAWIVLEATPADLGESQTQPPQTQMPTEAPTERPEITSRPTEPPEPETGTPSSEAEIPASPEAPGKKALRLDRLLWLLLPAAVWGCLEGQRWLRLRMDARTAEDRNRRALRLWGQLEKLHRLLKTPAPEEARILAEKAKYSRRGISREELEGLEEKYSLALEDLRERGWLWKLAGRYLFLTK